MATDRGEGATRALPVIRVARFREATRLAEQLVRENTDAFVAAGQEYRERHRDAAARPLTEFEVAQVARGLGKTLAETKAEVDDAGLFHVDEPEPQEVLLAAGVQTADAFLDAALRFVALLELPEAEFAVAREEDQLDEAIAKGVRELEDLDLQEARQRAQRALEHLAAAGGVEPGKAMGLVVRTVWQALQQAMTFLLTSSTSPTESSTPSPAPTAGTGATSSTTPAGEKLSA